MIKQPNPDDLAIGQRIRMIRQAKGISQERLAGACGVTFQQIQKYEKGTNRVGGSRMLQIAEALGIPVGVLFGAGSGAGEGGANAVENLFAGLDRADMAFIQRYRRLPPRDRAALQATAAAMAGGRADLSQAAE